jgi:DNA-binding NtrC family response regulator
LRVAVARLESDVFKEALGVSTVLVLDDDRTVHEPLRKAMMLHAMRVVRVVSAEAAVKALMTQPDVDMVVVDVTSRDAAAFLAKQAIQGIAERARVMLVDDDTKRDPRAMTEAVIERFLAARGRRRVVPR